MKNKKILVFSAIMILMVMILSGCKTTKTKSVTFDVETGDKIEIKMNAKNGYSLTTTTPVDFKKDDAVISTGSFMKSEYYDTYIQTVKYNRSIKVIEEKSKDNIEYIFYEYENQYGATEYDYIIKIKNSKTAFALANNKSKSEAEEIFNRIEFKVKK